MADFVAVEYRTERVEHRPSKTVTIDGTTYQCHQDVGPGWVIRLDPYSWEKCDIGVDDTMSRYSYRYGRLADGVFTPIVKSAL